MISGYKDEKALRTALTGYGRSRRGVWWWATDRDNPFGIALLVCPQKHEPTNRSMLMVPKKDLPQAHLFTLAELRKKRRKPRLIAYRYQYKLVDVLGWLIYEKGERTTWTLPERFHPDNILPIIEKSCKNRGKHYVKKADR